MYREKDIVEELERRDMLPSRDYSTTSKRSNDGETNMSESENQGCKGCEGRCRRIDVQYLTSFMETEYALLVDSVGERDVDAEDVVTYKDIVLEEIKRLVGQELPTNVEPVVCPSPIPEGFYYSRESARFYRIRDYCDAGMDFYEKWRSRAGEFPSPWEIQDHLGTCRGDEVAHSESEAKSKYAVKRNISSDDIEHWRAVRR